MTPTQDATDDELLRRIGALPAPTLPPALSSRVRERAGAAFARGERPPSPLAGVATTVAVVSAIAIYLTWAVEFLGGLARGG